jgi:hypothetical protein
MKKSKFKPGDRIKFLKTGVIARIVKVDGAYYHLYENTDKRSLNIVDQVPIRTVDADPPCVVKV